MEKQTVSAGKQQRSKEIERLKKIFEEVPGGVLTDYCGLTVEQMTDLRDRFRERGVSYQVVKNTLTRIAVEKTTYEGLEKMLKGNTGIAFGQEDPIAACKVATEFAKDHEALKIKGGFMDGAILSQQEVAELAKIPGKKELQAQFLAVINGPAQKLLGVLQGVPQKFLGVLDAQSRKVEGEAKA